MWGTVSSGRFRVWGGLGCRVLGFGWSGVVPEEIGWEDVDLSKPSIIADVRAAFWLARP